MGVGSRVWGVGCRAWVLKSAPAPAPPFPFRCVPLPVRPAESKSPNKFWNPPASRL